MDDPGPDLEMYGKYSGELFWVLVQLTEREAKATLKEMIDKGMLQDGFKALLILGKRFDNQTTASLLQLFLGGLTSGRPKLQYWHGNSVKLSRVISSWLF